MTIHDSQHVLALINFASCLSINWFCLCRLNTEKARLYWGARLRYTLLQAAATSSGLQPLLWGEWPSVADAGLSATVCLWLALSSWGRFAPHDGPHRRLGDS